MAFTNTDIETQQRKIRQEWIYTPCTGSKVFAENIEGCDGRIVGVRYQNQSWHIYGGSPTLSFNASIPGEYWKTEARIAARLIVNEIGGIAWDERGTVCLIVPQQFAVKTVKTMERFRELKHPGSKPDLRNKDLLIMEGVATGSLLSGRLHDLQQVHLEGVEIACVLGEKFRYRSYLERDGEPLKNASGEPIFCDDWEFDEEGYHLYQGEGVWAWTQTIPNIEGYPEGTKFQIEKEVLPTAYLEKEESQRAIGFSSIQYGVEYLVGGIQGDLKLEAKEEDEIS